MHSFHCGSAGKEYVCNTGDLGSTPGLGRSPGEGKGYPFQYSGLENSMDCIVHGVAKIWTQLSDFHLRFTVKHVGSVSQPGIEPVLYAVEAQDFNHWITREVLSYLVLKVTIEKMPSSRIILFKITFPFIPPPPYSYTYHIALSIALHTVWLSMYLFVICLPSLK